MIERGLCTAECDSCKTRRQTASMGEADALENLMASGWEVWERRWGEEDDQAVAYHFCGSCSKTIQDLALGCESGDEGGRERYIGDA